MPPLHPIGSNFRQDVWELLLQIPYGKTVTYGDIARELAQKRGVEKMSAQAVGGEGTASFAAKAIDVYCR